MEERQAASEGWSTSSSAAQRRESLSTCVALLPRRALEESAHSLLGTSLPPAMRARREGIAISLPRSVALLFELGKASLLLSRSPWQGRCALRSALHRSIDITAPGISSRTAVFLLSALEGRAAFSPLMRFARRRHSRDEEQSSSLDRSYRHHSNRRSRDSDSSSSASSSSSEDSSSESTSRRDSFSDTSSSDEKEVRPTAFYQNTSQLTLSAGFASSCAPSQAGKHTSSPPPRSRLGILLPARPHRSRCAPLYSNDFRHIEHDQSPPLPSPPSSLTRFSAATPTQTTAKAAGTSARSTLLANVDSEIAASLASASVRPSPRLQTPTNLHPVHVPRRNSHPLLPLLRPLQ